MDDQRSRPPDLIAPLGAMLREARRRRGFTQEKLARCVDCEAKWISEIECGRMPSMQVLLRVLDATRHRFILVPEEQVLATLIGLRVLGLLQRAGIGQEVVMQALAGR